MSETDSTTVPGEVVVVAADTTKLTFPEGARVLITDPTVVQLHDGTLVPLDAFEESSLPAAPTGNDVEPGFVQVEGHGYTDAELAERAANEAQTAITGLTPEVAAEAAPAAPVVGMSDGVATAGPVDVPAPDLTPAPAPAAPVWPTPVAPDPAPTDAYGNPIPPPAAA